MLAPHRTPARLFAALGLVLALLWPSAATAADRPTPGNFAGYGFDHYTAPEQALMDAWLRTSKFWAVGIYISGASRYDPIQPELTPEWVAAQLANRWRLLALTVGPQASCNTRYQDEPRISPDKANSYEIAREQGKTEADKTIAAAKALGIPKGSTLWYDLEHFDISKARCRESALTFLSAWTTRLHVRNWKSGVYSSGSSGIAALNAARRDRPGTYAMPDQLWIGDWNGRATVNSPYVEPEFWMPHARVHQYQGGHVETHGGQSLNIDSNFLDLGRGSAPGKPVRHCRGTNLDFAKYRALTKGDSGDRVRAAQCRLKEHGYFKHEVTGNFGDITAKAVSRYRVDRGFAAGSRIGRAVWAALLGQGSKPLLKYGAAGEAVRRLQRALNASVGAELPITGVFFGETAAAVRAFQAAEGLARHGVWVPELWPLLTTN
jgi:hypothetical protein